MFSFILPLVVSTKILSAAPIFVEEIQIAESLLFVQSTCNEELS